MGVKGLWQLLEPVGRPVTLESLEGKVLSVDASILLNQAVKGMRDKSGNPFPNAHLVVLFNRLCKLLFYRIKPIFVFDGGVPILKKKTLAARRERKFKARHGSNKAAEMLVKNYLKGKALETVTGKKSGSVIRNKSPKDPDIFELPPISKIQDTIEESSSESDDDDTNVLQQLYSQSNIEKKFQDPSLINVESDDFRSLPEEIQHELIKEKMEDRKWSTIESLPQDAFCFSDYQLQSVLHRGKLHQRLDELRKQMNNRNNGEVSGLSSKDAIGAESSVQSQRIVSEDLAHYVLIKTSKNNSNENKEFPMVDPSSEGGFFRDDPDVQPQQPKPTSLPRVRSFELDDVTCENSSDSDLDLSLLDVPEVVYDWETSQKKNEKGSLTVEVVREKDVRRGDAEGEQEDMNQYENIDCLGKNNEGTIQVQGNNFNRKSEENLDLVKGEKKDLVDLNEQNKTEVEETLNDLNLNEGGTEDSEAINAENDFNEQSKTEVKERSNDLILNEGETEDSEAINAEIDKRRSQIEMLLKTRERASLSSHGEVMEKTSDEYPANQNLEEDDNATVDKDYGRLVLQAGDDLNEFRLHLESSDEDDEDIISPREQLLTSDGNDMEDVETVQDKQRDQEISVVREGLEKDNPEITDQEEKLKVIIIDDQDNKANNNDKEGEDMEVEEEADLSSDETTEPEKETSIVPSEFTGTSKEDLEVMQVHLEMEQRSLQTEQARQERMAASISNEMVTESQELLRLFGVPYITSPMEAEAQCAFLDFTQQTSGTITDDSDVFLFGGRRVYKHIFNQNKHAELYTIDAISGHLALDRSKMIKLAFITGSDYTEGIQGLGVVGAMEVLQEFNNDGFEALQKFRKWHEETKKNKNSLQETKVKQKLRSLSLPAGFPSQEVFESYINPVIDESRETFEWGKPDLHALRLFAREKLGWSVVKTDDVLLPVLKQLNKQESQMRIDSFLQIKFQETRKKSSKRVRRVINRFNNPLSSSGSSSSEDEDEDKNKKLNSTSDRKTSDSQSNSGKGKGKSSGCRKKMTGHRVARGRGSSRGRRIPSTLQTEEDKADGSDGRRLNDRSVTSNDRDESVAILRENDITTEDGRGSTLGNRKRTEKGRKVEETNVDGKKAGNLNIELFDIQQQDEGYVMNKNNYYPKETNDIHDERTLKPQGDRNAEKMKGSNSLSNIENNLKVRRNLKTQGDRSNSISNVENSDVAVVDFMQKNNANNKKYKIPKKQFSTSIDESGSSGIGNLNDDSSTSSDTNSEEDRRIHSLSENIRRNKHGGRGLGRKRTRGRGRGGINKRSKIKM